MRIESRSRRAVIYDHRPKLPSIISCIGATLLIYVAVLVLSRPFELLGGRLLMELVEASAPILWWSSIFAGVGAKLIASLPLENGRIVGVGQVPLRVRVRQERHNVQSLCTLALS